MPQRPTVRLASLLLSALLTLAMLGAIDQLAQGGAPDAAPQWAQSAAPRA